MKNLMRIFIAVVAMFAYSCATDATNDLGVNIAGEKTTITLSFEETKTQLGELSGKTYPLYWSEGDQISVNGIASEPLGAEWAGKAKAEFTVNGIHAVYNIAYPATAENQVLFAATQTHANNTTFGKGVTTLYGVGSPADGVVLQHLTGVLKIGVTGSATLTKAVVSTADRAPIAGAFDIDFASGVVTPTATATPIIEYNFAEPVTLSSNTTYMHIAVPAGIYDEMYVTLYDNAGGAMFATIKADENKPLGAGDVRLFSNKIAYTANTAAAVISTADELIAWGASASTTNANAVLVADIDMTGKSWTPVGTFTGSFFGNGFAIKGLKAPLFGISNVKEIKGVHLVDVDITITSNPDAGALICDITNKDTDISHCSATGKMTLNLSSPTANHSYCYYGALIGYTITGKELHDLYTNVEIVVPATSVTKSNMYITHLAGRGGAADGNYISLRDVVCHGTINHNGSTGSGHLYVGGLSAAGVASLVNCVVGKPDSDGTSGSTTVGSGHGKNTYFGGLSTFLNTYTTVSNCHNYGNVTVGSSAGAIYVGGLIHSTRGGSMTDCSNHGKITITSKRPSATYYAGGVVASDDGGDKNQVNTYTRCNNYGDIEYTSNVEARYYNIGGVLARRETKNNTITLDDCHNYGNITFRGAILESSHIGGIVGIVGTAGVAPKAFTVKNCSNHGNINIESKLNLVSGTNGTLRIGGAIGTLVHSLQDVTGYVKNEGNVTCKFDNGSAADSESLCIGGLVGYTPPTTGLLNPNNLKIYNSGNVKVEFLNKTTFTYPEKGGIGGLVGLIGAPGAVKNAICNCEIEAIGLDSRTGFITGSAYDATTSVTNCQVAGCFITGYKEVVDEQADEVNYIPIKLILTSANLHDYIYSSAVTAEQVATDNITLYTE